MKLGRIHNTHILGVIKDTLVIILIFAGFGFIDFEVAAFVSVICTAILLTRRIIFDINPGFIVGHHINDYEKELIVPKGVDVFDLSKVPTMDFLRRYAEIMHTILAPPTILIIRFSGILQIEECDLFFLSTITDRLQKSDIVVIFSDVGKNVWLQLKAFGIEKRLGDGNICCNVGDAIIQADKLLHKPELE